MGFDNSALPIHAAAHSGNITAIRRELQNGVPVDVRSPADTKTALMVAAESDAASVETLAFLVDSGASLVERTSFSNKTALLFAVSDSAKFAFLLDRGAEPQAARSFTNVLPCECCELAAKVLLNAGFSPLECERNDLLCVAGEFSDYHNKMPAMTFCSLYNRWSHIRLFTVFGFSCESLKWTELMKEIMTGTVDSVASALSSTGDLAARDHNRRTPFLLSICSNDVAKAKLLKEGGGKFDERGQSDRSVLDFAIESAADDCLRWLLEESVNPEMPGRNGQAPLAVAAECGNLVAVRMLIEKCANINVMDERGGQALTRASNRACAEILIGAGADLNHGDAFGGCVLSTAVESGDLLFVQMLIERGASVYRSDMYSTPLHCAVNRDRVEMVKLLLKRGANPDAVEGDEGAFTPLRYARSREVTALLLAAGARTIDIDSSGHSAAEVHKEKDFVDLF